MLTRTAKYLKIDINCKIWKICIANRKAAIKGRNYEY